MILTFKGLNPLRSNSIDYKDLRIVLHSLLDDYEIASIRGI